MIKHLHSNIVDLQAWLSNFPLFLYRKTVPFMIIKYTCNFNQSVWLMHGTPSEHQLSLIQIHKLTQMPPDDIHVILYLIDRQETEHMLSCHVYDWTGQASCPNSHREVGLWGRKHYGPTQRDMKVK